MNELLAMRTFVGVVEAGSFSAAARVMGTTQPSVSRRVAELEAQLETSLLVRSTRRLSLTDAGRRYHEAALRALAAVDDARRAARSDRVEVRGRLRVTAPVSFSTAWLAPRLGRFLADNPGVDLMLSFSERHVDLVESGMDLGIRIGGPDRADLMGRRLGRIRRHLVASPGWVERHGHPRRLEELTSARGLVFSSEARWEGWPVRVDGEPRRLRPARILRATSGDFLRVLVLEGEGIALLPDWLVADPIARGELVELLPEAELEGLDLWMVWPHQRHQSLPARRFITWFAEMARERWAP